MKISVMIRVQGKLQDFETTTGKKASKILLGRQESLQLVREVYNETWGEDFLSTWEGRGRPEIYGVLVYIVNTDDAFLEVC